MVLDRWLYYLYDKDWLHERSSLTEFDNIGFDLSDTKCKKKLLGEYHGIALTKRFADEDPRSKEIIKYLNKIY